MALAEQIEHFRVLLRSLREHPTILLHSDIKQLERVYEKLQAHHVRLYGAPA